MSNPISQDNSTKNTEIKQNISSMYTKLTLQLAEQTFLIQQMQENIQNMKQYVITQKKKYCVKNRNNHNSFVQSVNDRYPMSIYFPVIFNVYSRDPQMTLLLYDD